MLRIEIGKHLRLLAIGVLTLVAVAANHRIDAALLYPLAASDPPEVVRLNHQSNLGLLGSEHADLLRQMAGASSSDIALENRRYGLAVERENAEFDAALKGANDRLRQEEADRQARLDEQARQIKAERDKLAETRREERLENIRQTAQAEGVEKSVQTGDAAVQRQDANPYGDASQRFKARRIQYPRRQWHTDTSTAAKDTASPAATPAPTQSLQSLERERRRLEALVELYPDRADLRQQLEEVRTKLANLKSNKKR